MLSSCPVELPKRLGWMKSGRFIRLASALLAVLVLAGVLYNAVMVDRIPPTFSIHVSSTTSSGLATTLTSVDVDFSEDVDHDTAQKAFSMTEKLPGNPVVGGTFHWQGFKLIFTPSVKLPQSTTFHVHVAGGVEDLDGNTQNGASDIEFTTVGPPRVTAAVPPTGADSVAVNSTISITFDRLMDTQKVLAGLTFEPDITYQASWNGTVLTLAPTRPMAYGTTYTVKIGDPAVDTDGSKLPPYVATFKTVGIGLRITALVPAPNVAGVSIRSQIAVTFDAPIDPSSINGAISVTPPVSGSTNVITLPDDRSPPSAATATPTVAGADVLVFTPGSALSPHTTYTVTMAATVKRTDGQVASAQTWSFTTGEAPANALNQISFVSGRGGVDNVWLMNPDGSNQREITSELVPVSGYDISGDGTTIAYAAGGVVKKMSISGESPTTLTSGDNLEYAPVFTPDGTGLIVGRRDGTGADQGYWRYPLLSGGDMKQILPDGAPGLGSVTMANDGLTGAQGLPSWAPRAAFTPDGTTMLLVRGSDSQAELVDLTGARPPTALGLRANARPVWIQSEGAFYLAGSADNGATWSLYEVPPTGAPTKVGSGSGDVATVAEAMAVVVKAPDGTYHIAYSTTAGGSTSLIVADPAFDESSPSFSPDGSTLVFGRVGSQTPGVSAGIWIAKTDGTGLTSLSTDGAYPRWLP